MAKAKKKSEVQIVEVPRVSSVPEKYKGVYQEYLDSPRPFDLRQQYAIINALYYELRDIVDSRVGARLQALEEDFTNLLTLTLAGKEPTPAKIQQAQKVAKIASCILMRQLPAYVPISTMLTQKDVENLSDLLERISRVAERMKKIQEGVELKVTIDMDMVLKLTREVFLPILPSVELKELALTRIRTFFLTRSGALREAFQDDEPIRSDPREWGESVRNAWAATAPEVPAGAIQQQVDPTELPAVLTEPAEDSGWESGRPEWDPDDDTSNPFL